MSKVSIPADVADQIFDILVATCDADEKHRLAFIRAVAEPAFFQEFLFAGALGYGGKFAFTGSHWYVKAYAEDLTPERQFLIDQANSAIRELQASLSPLFPNPS